MLKKCIGDDTKAAARQSPNCSKKKIQYGEKQILIWRMEFLHPAMWHNHDIDFVRWLHPAMWYVALESWQLIHQVAAPCNVTRGCGMICHWVRPNVRHIGVLLLVSISTVSQQLTCHSAPVCKIFIKISHLCHLGFRGSSKLLSFWENRLLVTYGQTDRQTNKWTGPSH